MFDDKNIPSAPARPITNLVAIDDQRLQDLTTFLHALWYFFVQIFLSLWLLWKLLGQNRGSTKQGAVRARLRLQQIISRTTTGRTSGNSIRSLIIKTKFTIQKGLAHGGCKLNQVAGLTVKGIIIMHLKFSFCQFSWLQPIGFPSMPLNS